jgi:hypothetical protein
VEEKGSSKKGNQGIREGTEKVRGIGMGGFSIVPTLKTQDD